MSRLLHTWITEQAARRPDATAIVLRDERLTYAELDRRTTLLAQRLRRAGCRPGERVALCIPKSPDAIVALVGILKAGGIYVPIDAGNPVARITMMLDAVEPCAIVATTAAQSLLAELAAATPSARDVPIDWIDAEASIAGARGRADDPVDAGTSPADIAYILFTSGSTGVPKGVPVTHASVAGFVEWATRYFELGPDDRVSGHSPLHFDLSVFDVFGAFAAGAELHLVPSDTRLVAPRLAEFIRGAELTQWFSVPSVMTYLAHFDAVRQDDFPALRRVLWCGDVLPTRVLRYWMRRLPHASFTNLYGPTEAAIASSYYTVPACPDDDRAPIPIGTACEGEELVILDETLRPVAPGVIGDLYIRGVGLSPGYWKNDEKTRAAFIYPPGRHDAESRMYRTGDLAHLGDDGLVYFHGRADWQVKSRGHRIELGEIDAALSGAPGVADCSVVALPTDGFEGVTLCCAYVARPGAPVTVAALREFLATRLPSYMLPSRWLALDRLPTNANGKTDRGALRELFQREADHA